MPRGRKRKIASFVPPPWIPNSSSEDENNREREPPPGLAAQIPGHGNV